MSVLALFFGWPDGGIWPNIVADALVSGLGLVWSYRRLARRLEAHTEQRLAEHRQALMEHITTTAATQPQSGDPDP